MRRRTGLRISETRRADFEDALDASMHRLAISDPSTYLARLGTDARVLDDLVADITVSETYFFRDPNQWRLVRDRILPELRARAPLGTPLRMWSAGCATGEEPYTLAVVADELGLGDGASIVATDLSRAALALARRACYNRWSLRGVPESVVARSFELVGNEYRLAPAVRDAVDFRYLNLAEDVYPSLASGIWSMDLILCRNVLIYFDNETAARVIRALVRCLAPHGWLLLGASDPPANRCDDVEVLLTDAGLAYRRAAAGVARAAVQTWAPEAGAARAEPEGAAAPAGPVERNGASPRVSADMELDAMESEARAPPDQGADALAAAADAAYRAGDYRLAATLADRIVREGGGDLPTSVLLVRAYANQGALEAAGRACAAALDRHRMSAEVLYLHGLLSAAAGRHAAAVGDLRRALYLDRHLAVVYLTLGGELLRTGDLAGARRAFTAAQRLLTGLPADAVVPASDGQRAGRLAAMARVQLELLRQATA
ncbi:MAG TPA: protein-glutamate O-methyltransferase CheR [Gemmatimonadales bacterium]